MTHPASHIAFRPPAAASPRFDLPRVGRPRRNDSVVPATATATPERSPRAVGEHELQRRRVIASLLARPGRGDTARPSASG